MIAISHRTIVLSAPVGSVPAFFPRNDCNWHAEEPEALAFFIPEVLLDLHATAYNFMISRGLKSFVLLKISHVLLPKNVHPLFGIYALCGNVAAILPAFRLFFMQIKMAITPAYSERARVPVPRYSGLLLALIPDA